ncbi:MULTISPECIES: hypothetical protein [Bacillus]|uniref:LPXTG cell wall anchor domain-containing protein n=1 Tax=Bacillus pseudomycoides TaxID=64104 RepID=A0A1Y3MFV6_9BACI|nr:MULTISPECIES: hypothetical protein [Bacillus cereus group]EOP55745.1 hypothetical protein IIW_00663 [Bacillus cereus VD136]EOP74490.1 hypothetical protein KOW_02970 [Bacillus cereus VDM006]EOQ12333.1 hypothetical protein KOY_00608 [Bacillus cereus VDM021]OOG91545.1 hypothetical protein BTH41_01481 [Bacillus mycoides]MDF2082097.1 hypothetical protein [Bacillus pseudomycoides]
MENFIDQKLDDLFDGTGYSLFGGNSSTILGANIVFSIILILIGTVLIKNRKNSNKKSSIGSMLLVFGLVMVVFNLIRIVL